MSDPLSPDYPGYSPADYSAPPPSAAADRLQQLLSRAVEDQVSEQRALYGVLEEVRAALTAVQGVSPAEIRSSVEAAVQGSVGRLDADLRATGAGLQARLDEVLRRVDESAATTSAALEGGEHRDVEDLIDGVAGMRTDLRMLPEQLGGGLAAALGGGIGEIRQLVGSLAEGLAAVRGENAVLVQRLDLLPQIGAAVGNVNDRLRALEGASAHQDVGRSELALAGLADRLAGVGEELGELRGLVGQLGALSPVAKEVSALRLDLDRLRQSLAEDTGSSEQIASVVREGVRDAVRDFVRDTLRDAVREVVTVTTRDTERRLAAHVDEAVLTLAQALLRRRDFFPTALEAGPSAPPRQTSPRPTPSGPGPARQTPPRPVPSPVYAPPPVPAPAPAAPPQAAPPAPPQAQPQQAQPQQAQPQQPPAPEPAPDPAAEPARRGHSRDDAANPPPRRGLFRRS